MRQRREIHYKFIPIYLAISLCLLVSLLFIYCFPKSVPLSLLSSISDNHQLDQSDRYTDRYRDGEKIIATSVDKTISKNNLIFPKINSEIRIEFQCKDGEAGHCIAEPVSINSCNDRMMSITDLKPSSAGVYSFIADRRCSSYTFNIPGYIPLTARLSNCTKGDGFPIILTFYKELIVVGRIISLNADDDYYIYYSYENSSEPGKYLKPDPDGSFQIIVTQYGSLNLCAMSQGYCPYVELINIERPFTAVPSIKLNQLSTQDYLPKAFLDYNQCKNMLIVPFFNGMKLIELISWIRAMTNVNIILHDNLDSLKNEFVGLFTENQSPIKLCELFKLIFQLKGWKIKIDDESGVICRDG